MHLREAKGVGRERGKEVVDEGKKGRIGTEAVRMNKGEEQLPRVMLESASHFPLYYFF